MMTIFLTVLGVGVVTLILSHFTDLYGGEILILFAILLVPALFVLDYRSDEKVAQRAQDSLPFTEKTDVGDGCVLYKHYPKGKSGYSDKFVKCTKDDGTHSTSTTNMRWCGKNCARAEQIMMEETK